MSNPIEEQNVSTNSPEIILINQNIPSIKGIPSNVLASLSNTPFFQKALNNGINNTPKSSNNQIISNSNDVKIENTSKIISPIDKTPIIENGVIIDKNTISPIPVSKIPQRKIDKNKISPVNFTGNRIYDGSNDKKENISPELLPTIPTSISPSFPKSPELKINSGRSGILSPQTIIANNSPKFVILADPEIESPDLSDEKEIITKKIVQKISIESGGLTPLPKKDLEIKNENYILSEVPKLVNLSSPSEFPDTPVVPPIRKNVKLAMSPIIQNVIMSKEEEEEKLREMEIERLKQIEKIKEAGKEMKRLKELEKEIDKKKRDIEKNRHNQEIEGSEGSQGNERNEQNEEIQEEEEEEKKEVIPKKNPYNYIPDFNSMSFEDQLRCRINYEIKFADIAKAYPHFNVKIPTKEDSLKNIHIRYMQYVKKTTIESGVFDFRQCLTLFWCLIELLCTKVLGINATGYTMHMVMRMNKYDDLLRQLGEKHDFSIGSSWSIEVQLLFWSGIHALIFILMNYIVQWLGPVVGGQIKNMIENFSTGKIIYPTQDAQGNIVVPAAVPSNPDHGYVAGIPLAQMASGLSNLNFGANKTQQEKKENKNNNSTTTQPKKKRPAFVD